MWLRDVYRLRNNTQQHFLYKAHTQKLMKEKTDSQAEILDWRCKANVSLVVVMKWFSVFFQYLNCDK